MTDVSDLIRQEKSDRIAWLPGDASLAEVGETMVAIANNAGGHLLIGMADSVNAPVTVYEPEAITDRIVEAALQAEPALIIPLPRHEVIDGKVIVIAQIPAGLPSVYAFDGRYLIRQEANNIPLKPRDLRRLMLERGEMSFETEEATQATLDDIDWEKATEYVKQLRGIDTDNVHNALVKRGCLTREYGDSLRPTNAGILLFGKEPQSIIRGAEITAVRFAGTTMTDTHTRQDIKGTLIDQIKRAETFLYDHLRKAVVLQDTMARKENYEYPMEAARELVVNAVAHRDYSIRGDTIRLFVFSDRMEVHSPGRLPGPMTISNIKDERFSRNPVIVQVLSDLHFIERLGYGVDRVLELLKEQNLPEPDFQERAGGFTVTVHNSALQTETESTPATSETEEVAPPPVSLNGVYQDQPINVRQEGALLFLLKDENSRITNSDLQNLFPDVHAETIRRDLVDLVSKDILVKMGQKRGSYYILKTTVKEQS